MCEGDQTRSDRHSGARGGPAGRKLRAPRAPGDAFEERLAAPEEPELRRRGLTHAREACVLDGLGVGHVACGHVAVEEPGAHRGAKPWVGQEILGEERDARERTRALSGAGALRDEHRV